MRFPICVRVPILRLSLVLLCLAGVVRAQEMEPQPPLLPPVRVKLASLGVLKRLTARGAGLRVRSGATGDVLALQGDTVSLRAAGREVAVGDIRAASVRIEAETLTLEAGKVERVYPGAVIVTAGKGGLSCVNECSLEAYVQGVLCGECPALFHPEAIRAMAVAVRSYSYRKAYLTLAELCDTTHCQVYRGTGSVRSSIREAVEATRGRTALYEGEVIDAVYSSDCGGYTEANDEAWKGAKALPYLRPVEDAPEPQGEPFCAVNRAHRWSLALPRPRLQSLFGKTAADLKLEVAEVTESGRARRIQLAPAVPPAGCGEREKVQPAARVFTGDQWRQLLGLSVVKSLKFEVRETEGGVELEGRGWGHGVGLCQFGANGMARQEIPHADILRHYYSGVTVGPAPDARQARRRYHEKRLAARRAPEPPKAE